MVLHPGLLIKNAEVHLQLDSGSLELDGEFHAQVDTPDQLLPVFLLRCKQIDPPRAQVAEQGGRFIAITEARNYAPTELALLRRAYAVIMEG